MWRRLAAVAALSGCALSGCVFGDHKTRYTASGITIGIGGAIALAPALDSGGGSNDEQLATAVVALAAGGAIMALGLLGVIATAADLPPSPNEWKENEPHLVRQADLASRAGQCETSNAIARQVYAEHEDDYRRDFLTNPVIVGCMQAGWTKARSTPASPASR